jgi:hypothetical protein
VLAMIHDRLAHKAEARRCIKQAAEFMKSVGPASKGDTCEAQISCLDWIELNVLSREAEKLLRLASNEPVSGAAPKAASTTPSKEQE